MNEKEQILAKKILDRLRTTKTNACTVRERIEKIEQILLGSPSIDEDKEESSIPDGLLNEIHHLINLTDCFSCDSIRTTNVILREIEIK